MRQGIWKLGGKKGTKFKVKRKTYMVDPNSGTLFAEVSSPPPGLPAIPAENLSSFVAESMCKANIDELTNTAWDAICGMGLTDFTGFAVPFSNCFLLNSGSTVHMSPSLYDFSLIHNVDGRRVRGVNGSTVDVKGVGDIHLCVHGSDAIFILKDALHVPGVDVCLVPVALLMEDLQGSVLFESDKATIYNAKHNIVATGICVVNHKLWKLNASAIQTDVANIAAPGPDLETWHGCLGHANNQAIYEIATKGLAGAMHVDLSSACPKCGACVLGKQTRMLVPSSCMHVQSSRWLQVVWIDLAGPQEIPSVKPLFYDDH
jgi:hypothetical protein